LAYGEAGALRRECQEPVPPTSVLDCIAHAPAKFCRVAQLLDLTSEQAENIAIFFTVIPERFQAELEAWLTDRGADARTVLAIAASEA
jgi:hypothetical protein